MLGRLAVQKADLGAAEAALEQANLEARNANLPGLELLGLALIRDQVLAPQARAADATRRMEELARSKLRKPLAELQDLLDAANSSARPF